MKRCIYCCEDKDENEFTLEHVIPQFLGGAYAPDRFKIRDVCRSCNSNLGLFVDAGFEKNWFVSNKLSNAAYAFFDPHNPVGLPLICMGKCDLTPPLQHEDEVCESWLGPLGEQIYWIRPDDKRLYWYAGGNPRSTKTTESRAYFLFSERSLKNPQLSWLSFRDAFEGKRVKKLMCTKVHNANPADIGFKEPDEIDLVRIKYFTEVCKENKTRNIKMEMYTKFDFRFLAKLARGIAYSLFGRKALQTQYAEQLYKALWYREGADKPLINGTSAFLHESDPHFSRLMGEENSVTITIMSNPEGISVILNLDASLSWVVMCASHEGLTEEDISPLQAGQVIILYRQLQQGFAMGLPEYLAHKCGDHPHPKLTAISEKSSLYRDYFKNL